MKLNKITFREIKSDEISVLVEYRIIFLRELQGEQAINKELELKEKLHDYFKKSITDNTFIGLIAEIDKIPVGFGGMVIQQIPGNFKLINGFEGYILSMYTLPEYRKNGIAKEILKRLVKKGKDLGIGKFYLHASKDGKNLYRKFGFKEPDLPILEI
jgi:ribosomal protein S18 acetylase RimI-like enzyme